MSCNITRPPPQGEKDPGTPGGVGAGLPPKPGNNRPAAEAAKNSRETLVAKTAGLSPSDLELVGQDDTLSVAARAAVAVLLVVAVLGALPG